MTPKEIEKLSSPENTLFFKEHEFEGDEVKYITPSWEEMGRLSFYLARSILGSSYQNERLITLAKGGWTWSRTLADYLSIEKVGSIQIKFYTNVYSTAEKPIIIQSLPISVIGENVLLFDDVVDSGRSLETAKKYLEMCGSKEIKTATLFYKPWSSIRPDFFGTETTAWVIFPHEIRESVDLIGRKWLDMEVSLEEIKGRFLEIGLPQEQVAFFLKKTHGKKI